MPSLRRCLPMLVVLLAISVAPAYSAPAVTNFSAEATSNSQPTAITSGPQGALWSTGTANPGRVLKITTAGAVTEFVGGTVTDFNNDARPSGIAHGPDGNLWVTERSKDKLLRLTPAGVAVEFGGLTSGDPTGITAGPDGRIWFTEQKNGGGIGRMATDGSGAVGFTAGLTSNSIPNAIVAGPDGNLWFTERAADKIGRITPAGTITEFSSGITPGRAPGDIAVGPDGALWFTETGGTGGIGRITTSGVVTEFFTGLTPTGTPQGIAAGADGALWFTKSASPAAVGRITVDGTITEHFAGIAASAQPLGITAGPDGAMWLADSAGTKGSIGRITIPPAAGAAVASDVTPTSAEIAATVTPNGSPTTYRFEYTLAGGPTATTPEMAAGNGAGAVAVSAQVSGLAAGTKYAVRLVGTNDAGMAPGQTADFITSAVPSPPPGPEPTAPVAPAPPVSPSRSASPARTDAHSATVPLARTTSIPMPVLTKSVVVGTANGTVRFRPPGAAGYTTLKDETTLPVGTIIDATSGKVRLDSALPGGARQRAEFSHGSFSVTQPVGRTGLVGIHLRGGRFRSCDATIASASKASGGKRKRRGGVVRRLWGSDRHGRFQTHGRDSVATVRGTRWLTEDRCDGTLTKVASGVVDVRPRGSNRHVRLRAGGAYLARAER